MFTNRSIRFIKENKDKPFFLYLAHTAPHTPLLVSDIYKGKSKRGLYGDVVEEIDKSVGRLLKTLKDLNIAKNTFVIFTSDNGPWGWAGIDGGSSGLLRGNKGSVYEGGFRVPAIAWMPGSVPQGVTSNVICSALDLLPTFMSIAGVKNYENQGLDGLDISNSFFNNEPVRSDIQYYRQDTLVALRHNEWKIYIKDPNPWNDEFTNNDLPLLYNVDHDPSEKYNIKDEHKAVADDLIKLSEQYVQNTFIAPSEYDSILPEFQKAYNEYNKSK
jgi:arylsulfatase A-like enzyme